MARFLLKNVSQVAHYARYTEAPTYASFQASEPSFIHLDIGESL